jgi:hypothetical protein
LPLDNKNKNKLASYQSQSQRKLDHPNSALKVPLLTHSVFHHNAQARIYHFPQKCAPILRPDSPTACETGTRSTHPPRQLTHQLTRTLLQHNRILLNYKKLTHLEQTLSKNTRFLKRNFDYLLSQLKTTVTATNAPKSKPKPTNKIVDAFNAQYEKAFTNAAPEPAPEPKPKVLKTDSVSFVKRRETLYSNNSSVSYFKLAKAALSQKNKNLFSEFQELDYERIRHRKSRPKSVSVCVEPSERHVTPCRTKALARLRAKYPELFAKNEVFREQIDFSKSMVQFTICLQKILTKVEKVTSGLLFHTFLWQIKNKNRF